MANKIKHPKVFISYSWTSREYEKRVLDLAERLVSDGVDVIFDKWSLKEGQDKYAFMEKMVTDKSVEKVLILCDRGYMEKADKKKGGVGVESQIISPEIYNKVEQDKFIPVVMEKDKNGQPFLPTFLKGRIYIDLSSRENFFKEYEKLLRNIYNKPLYEKPQLGNPPIFITQETHYTLKTRHKYESFKEAITSGKSYAIGLARDYLNTFKEALKDFYIKPEEGVELDDKVIENLRIFKPYRDQFIEFIKLIFTYSEGKDYLEEIHSFLEKMLEVKSSAQIPDNFDFILWEKFLYLITLLIKFRKYQYASFFLSEKYFYRTNIRREDSYFMCFCPYTIKALDEYRNQRLKLNRLSVAVDILKDRCDLEDISFEDLMQTDFILCIRSFMFYSEGEDYVPWWAPKTLVYLPYGGEEPFDLFYRASSKRYFDVLKVLFGVKNKQDFLSKLEKADQIINFSNWHFGWYRILWRKLLNLDKLYEG